MQRLKSHKDKNGRKQQDRRFVTNERAFHKSLERPKEALMEEMSTPEATAKQYLGQPCKSPEKQMNLRRKVSW